jgi:hypothetical protein
MHKSDGVDNVKHFDGKLGRQQWTETRLVIDMLMTDAIVGWYGYHEALH